MKGSLGYYHKSVEEGSLYFEAQDSESEDVDYAPTLITTDCVASSSLNWETVLNHSEETSHYRL